MWWWWLDVMLLTLACTLLAVVLGILLTATPSVSAYGKLLITA